MVMGGFGTATAHAPSGMVATADHLASSAGVAILRAGGTAADAAVAAGAVLAVTNQHQCGMGGDLFALVHTADGHVDALCGAGRAGSGADSLQARVEGLDRLPTTGDVRTVTVPGCVDGWIELHRRHGRLPFDQVLEAAITYAATGFPASPLLGLMAPLILELPGADDYLEPAMAAGGRLPPGTLLRRPGVAVHARGDRRTADGPGSTSGRSATGSSPSAAASSPAATSRGPRPSGSSRSPSRPGATRSTRPRRRPRAT